MVRKINEHVLNEGPGAGYMIKTNNISIGRNISNYIKINKFDVDNEDCLSATVNCKIPCKADVTCSVYDWRVELKQVDVIIDKLELSCLDVTEWIDLYDEETNTVNIDTLADIICDDLSDLCVSYCYGGSWQHIPFNGILADDEMPDSGTLYIYSISCHMSKKYEIDKIEDEYQEQTDYYDDTEYYDYDDEY